MIIVIIVSSVSHYLIGYDLYNENIFEFLKASL